MYMNVDLLLQTTILYLKCKKIQKLLLPYSWYKNQIRYISKIQDEKIIRLVFNKLLKKDIINRFKHHKSTFYIFNPYQQRFNIYTDFNITKQDRKIYFN